MDGVDHFLDAMDTKVRAALLYYPAQEGNRPEVPGSWAGKSEATAVWTCAGDGDAGTAGGDQEGGAPWEGVKEKVNERDIRGAAGVRQEERPDVMAQEPVWGAPVEDVGTGPDPLSGTAEVGVRLYKGGRDQVGRGQAEALTEGVQTEPTHSGPGEKV